MNKIFLTDDGSHSLMSETFGDSYHSKFGAIQESQHIFIEAALNYQTAKGKKDLTILEVGFGTGLNALMTFREAERQNLSIHYLTLEKYPLSIEQADMLNYAKKLSIDSAIFKTLHNSNWGETCKLSEHFVFEKRKMDCTTTDIHNFADIIYFDAFAPQIQPELWEVPILQRFFAALNTGGVLTTYCAKGAVKRALKEVGFQLESIPGPTGKREMTRAFKN
ncbi:MAG: tRNA (5-methylaminomethyl-2-thiouridine)(34)-methyltransferase MnmD [Saprospiraceae bacterium]|nr:tRNA (5-methylaminomethyl-2-thiouridine)(34)-methyltransferase MnmD [Saprospiraceae bacterium]